MGRRAAGIKAAPAQPCPPGRPQKQPTRDFLWPLACWGAGGEELPGRQALLVDRFQDEQESLFRESGQLQASAGLSLCWGVSQRRCGWEIERQRPDVLLLFSAIPIPSGRWMRSDLLAQAVLAAPTVRQTAPWKSGLDQLL